MYSCVNRIYIKLLCLGVLVLPGIVLSQNSQSHNISPLQTVEKVSVRSDGVLLVKGKPFYPFAAYRDPRDILMDFRGVLDAGFNTTHSYYFEDRSSVHNGGIPIDQDIIITAQQYLQAAHENGLKVFQGIPRDMIKARNINAIRQYVEALKLEPALLVWYLLDEPSIRKVSPEILRKINHIVKVTDPNHPTFVVFSGKTRDLKVYKGSYDIAGFDPYPIRGKKGKVDVVRRIIEERKNQISDIFPVWHVVQANDYRKPENGIYYPTPDQIRCMVFLGIIAGARGTCYYWWPSSTCDILKFPNVWNAIQETNYNLRNLEYILTAKDSDPDVILIQQKGEEILPMLVRKWQDDQYAFIANPSEREIMVILQLPTGLLEVQDLLMTNYDVYISNGLIKILLKPYGVYVAGISYKL